MRLFVAIDLTEPIIDTLSALQEAVGDLDGIEMRCVEPSQLHLTLQFLGNVTEEQLPELMRALEGVQCKPFKLCLNSMNVLPNQKHIRIIYVDLVGREIASLAKQIKEAVAPFLNEEQHDFLSHVTIARVKSVENPETFIKALSKIKVPEVCFMTRRFALKRSELSSDGAEHTMVKEYKLGSCQLS